MLEPVPRHTLPCPPLDTFRAQPLARPDVRGRAVARVGPAFRVERRRGSDRCISVGSPAQEDARSTGLKTRPWIVGLGHGWERSATCALSPLAGGAAVRTAVRDTVKAMPRERTFTYSARSWEEAVDRAARDAVENGWTIVDWHWEEPHQDLLGVFIVIVEELELN